MTVYDLPVTVYESPEELGEATAALAANTLRGALKHRGRARVMLAAAPSQAPTLAALAREDVDFTHVEFFHMDDYLRLDRDAPQGFGNWLQANFFDHLLSRSTFARIDTALPPDMAAARYASAMGEEPFDVTLCGLGVNAHLAFNDPPADFDDPQAVRVVELSNESRMQQVGEGHFSDLDAVPTRALTVTIPRLLNASTVICSVLGTAKRDAVRRTISLMPTQDVPGTALKLHPCASLHVDLEASIHE